MKPPRPLIIGWVPSKTKLALIMSGRESELPGYWLYQLQGKFLPGRLGRFCGWVFGKIYADRKVYFTHDR